MVVYVIRNKYTGREYVGITVRTLAARWRDHLSACFTKRLRNPMYAEMRKAGKAAFEITQLEEVDDYESLVAREKAVILERQTLYPLGYNMCSGGRGNYGWKPSPDVRAHMSQGQRGRVLSPETKAKLSAFFRGRPNLKDRGHKRPAWNKGIPHTEATKAKMRAAGARPWSEKERSGHVGLKRTPESRALIAERKRQWWASMSHDERASHINKMRGKA